MLLEEEGDVLTQLEDDLVSMANLHILMNSKVEPCDKTILKAYCLNDQSTKQEINGQMLTYIACGSFRHMLAAFPHSWQN